MVELTQAQREALLTRAVEAMRAYRTIGPDTDPDQAARLTEVASMAVTDAVTRGGYLHTQITQMAGCTGLQVIGLITDWSAQGRALLVEDNAAKNYHALVRAQMRRYAARRVGAEGYGAKTATAQDLGVTRKTLDDWIERVAQEDAPVH